MNWKFGVLGVGSSRKVRRKISIFSRNDKSKTNLTTCWWNFMLRGSFGKLSQFWSPDTLRKSQLKPVKFLEPHI